MKRIKQLLGGIALTLLTSHALLAQSGIVPSGGDAMGTDGQVSYSCGQIDYLYMNDTTGSVSSGIQQPFEIFTLSGLEEKNISLKLPDQLAASIYPNPSIDFVTLKIEAATYSALRYELYDMQWKLIREQQIGAGETRIDLTAINSAAYYVRVLNQNQSVKLFKVIKTQ